MSNKDIADAVLGKNIGVPEKYSPEILVRILRSENRELYQIDSTKFCGKDIWHCFECYVANDTATSAKLFDITIEYSSDSKYIVESKSLKLYLNSFNNGFEEYFSIEDFIIKIREDLSKLLETLVSVYENPFYQKREESHSLNPSCSKDNRLIHVIYEAFKSKCKVTNQPDFGAVWIQLKNAKKPYSMDYFDSHVNVKIKEFLFSMKNENHFHEECCELIFKKVMEMFSPDELTVVMNFTRRGGISICPVRSTNFNYKTYLWERE